MVVLCVASCHHHEKGSNQRLRLKGREEGVRKKKQKWEKKNKQEEEYTPEPATDRFLHAR
jgi:hypothetical protein